MVKEEKVSDLKIRQYRTTDRKGAISMLEELKDLVSTIDVWDIEARKSDYGEKAIRELLKKSANGKILIAETKDGPIGMVAAHIWNKAEHDRLAVKGKVRYGEITHLYINEDYRRSGVGRKLMDAAESYLKKGGCSHIRVSVFFPNVKAQKFYEQLDYRLYNVEYIRKV